MSVEEVRSLKIRYINGTEKNFAFVPLEGKFDSSTIMTHLHKALDSRRLILQMAERLVLIPFDNIESIEISPAPGLHIQEAIQVVNSLS
jgi:hypothetical protein